MNQMLTLRLGELATNCYLLWSDDKKCVIIDPADEAVAISDEIEARGLVPMAILATHCHFDHILAAMELKLIYKIPFCASQKDDFLLKRMVSSANYWMDNKQALVKIDKIDIDLNIKDEITVGEMQIEIIKTPGHTPGGVSFYLKDNGWLFDGDTLFAEGEGRTDLSYSNQNDLAASVKKILKLPCGTEIFAGHGESFRN